MVRMREPLCGSEQIFTIDIDLPTVFCVSPRVITIRRLKPPLNSARESALRAARRPPVVRSAIVSGAMGA
jgi:hypothetical protein